MRTETITVLEECTQGSIAGSMSFPVVVQHLMEIGAESYHVDLYRREKTYYFPNGETYVESMDIPFLAISQDFSSAKVTEAIRGSQRQEITYMDFLQQITEAGSTHYYVYLKGRQAVYYGRSGDCHVEPFPSQK